MVCFRRISPPIFPFRKVFSEMAAFLEEYTLFQSLFLQFLIMDTHITSTFLKAPIPESNLRVLNVNAEQQLALLLQTSPLQSRLDTSILLCH